MGTLKCIVIDDEELARTLLKTYIEKLNFLELAGDFESPLEAMSMMRNTPVDLVFLDIQMPELKGTDFARTIHKDTQVIFTTAYSEYALEGFELNALDYLLKPITFERFLKAVSKLKDPSAPDMLNDSITIKSGYDLYKLTFDSILYIESYSEYVIFHTADKKIMSYQTLKSLEKILPSLLFMRVHRSFIINKKKISALKGRDILISERKIPVSNRYYDLVKQELF